MVQTFKEKFNLKYGFPKGTSHSIAEISKLTGYKLSGLQTVFNRGIGAYRTSPQSVRPNVVSPEQWAMARIYASVSPGSKSSKIDKMFLIKK